MILFVLGKISHHKIEIQTLLITFCYTEKMHYTILIKVNAVVNTFHILCINKYTTLSCCFFFKFRTYKLLNMHERSPCAFVVACAWVPLTVRVYGAGSFSVPNSCCTVACLGLIEQYTSIIIVLNLLLLYKVNVLSTDVCLRNKVISELFKTQ